MGLEATGNALAVARLIEPHVARVVVANAAVTKSIGAAGAKTDKLDARTLARLLGTGFFPEVWLAEEPTRLARRRCLTGLSWSRSGRGPRIRFTRS